MNLHDKRRAILASMEEQKAAIAHIEPDDGIETETLRRAYQADRAQS